MGAYETFVFCVILFLKIRGNNSSDSLRLWVHQANFLFKQQRLTAKALNISTVRVRTSSASKRTSWNESITFCINVLLGVISKKHVSCYYIFTGSCALHHVQQIQAYGTCRRRPPGCHAEWSFRPECRVRNVSLTHSSRSAYVASQHFPGSSPCPCEHSASLLRWWSVNCHVIGVRRATMLRCCSCCTLLSCLSS